MKTFIQFLENIPYASAWKPSNITVDADDAYQYKIMKMLSAFAVWLDERSELDPNILNIDLPRPVISQYISHQAEQLNNYGEEIKKEFMLKADKSYRNKIAYKNAIDSSRNAYNSSRNAIDKKN